ncbi:MAG: DUF4347 domain-containing protein [Elainella sp.]
MTSKAIRSLILIDAGVDELQSLIAAAQSDSHLFILTPDQDGIEQITQTLAQYRSEGYSIASLHIVSHGAPATLLLGNSTLDLAALPRYESQLAEWGTALGQDSSILLYGCEVAAGDAGEEFVTKISRMTGATVGASRSLTGSAALGGNWELEVQTGPVAGLPFVPEALSSYSAVLPTVRVSSGKLLELVGGKVGSEPEENRRGVFFPSAGLGVTGGVNGTSGGAGFGIIRMGISPNLSSAIDAMALFVNGQVLTPSAEVTVSAGTLLRSSGDTDPVVQSLPVGFNDFLIAFNPKITTDPVTMSGLVVTQEISLEVFDRSLMRTYTTFQNPTNQDISIPVSWATNFAYDGDTLIKATQSGDTAFTVDDRWLVADDSNDGFAGAAIGQLFYGPGAPALKPTSVSTTVFNTPKTSNADNRQGAVATFNLAVPANSTKALVFFTTDNATTANAIANMQTADDNSSGLFYGLSEQQLTQIVNWDFNTGIIISPLGGNTTSEAGGTASFNIVLKSQPSSSVTLNLASSNPQEGTVSAPSLTFTPANWNQPQQLTVTGVDDTADDGNVGYRILTSFSTSDPVYSTIQPADIDLVNIDNDDPPAVNPGTGGNTGGNTGSSPDDTTGDDSDSTDGSTNNNPDNNIGSEPNSPVGEDSGSDITINVADLVRAINASENTASNVEANDDIVTGQPTNQPPSGQPVGRLLRGTRGKDTLTGTAQDDTLLGRGGDDKLFGESGDDTLLGGKGRNQLWGGEGEDLFGLRKGGIAVIHDFQDGLDQIGLSQDTTVKGLDLERRGNNMLIQQGDQVLAVLKGVQPGQISAADFTKL